MNTQLDACLEIIRSIIIGDKEEVMFVTPDEFDRISNPDEVTHEFTMTSFTSDPNDLTAEVFEFRVRYLSDGLYIASPKPVRPSSLN